MAAAAAVAGDPQSRRTQSIEYTGGRFTARACARARPSSELDALLTCDEQIRGAQGRCVATTHADEFV